MRVLILVAVLLTAGLAGCVGSEEAPTAEPGGRDTGPEPIWGAPESLAIGQAAFWDLPRVQGDRGDTVEECVADTAAACFNVTLADGAHRFRVALDHDSPGGQYRLALYDPKSRLAAQASEANVWSLEVFAMDPVPGKWTMLVETGYVLDDPPRLRAKLESEPTPLEGELLPNLRPLIPFDLHIRGGLSCTPDETAEDQATRCLRFAFGYANLGDGPYDVHFSPIEDGLLEGPVEQRIHHADGSATMEPAGTYAYHVTHDHYHYQGILNAELHEEVRPGELSHVVEAAKRGACAHDYRLANWSAFIAEPYGSQDSGDDCSFNRGMTPRDGARIGLTVGWTDIYESHLSGNYVDAADVTDGRYVLRATIDAEDDVRETDESDNVGYTYFEVRGNEVTILERGLGSDPWDHDKIVTKEWVP